MVSNVNEVNLEYNLARPHLKKKSPPGPQFFNVTIIPNGSDGYTNTICENACKLRRNKHPKLGYKTQLAT